jgi:hypothetical protein
MRWGGVRGKYLKKNSSPKNQAHTAGCIRRMDADFFYAKGK